MPKIVLFDNSTINLSDNRYKSKWGQPKNMYEKDNSTDLQPQGVSALFLNDQG